MKVARNSRTLLFHALLLVVNLWGAVTGEDSGKNGDAIHPKAAEGMTDFAANALDLVLVPAKVLVGTAETATRIAAKQTELTMTDVDRGMRTTYSAVMEKRDALKDQVGQTGEAFNGMAGSMVTDQAAAVTEGTGKIEEVSSKSIGAAQTAAATPGEAMPSGTGPEPSFPLPKCADGNDFINDFSLDFDPVEAAKFEPVVHLPGDRFASTATSLNVNPVPKNVPGAGAASEAGGLLSDRDPFGINAAGSSIVNQGDVGSEPIKLPFIGGALVQTEVAAGVRAATRVPQSQPGRGCLCAYGAFHDFARHYGPATQVFHNQAPSEMHRLGQARLPVPQQDVAKLEYTVRFESAVQRDYFAMYLPFVDYTSNFTSAVESMSVSCKIEDGTLKSLGTVVVPKLEEGQDAWVFPTFEECTSDEFVFSKIFFVSTSKSSADGNMFLYGFDLLSTKTDLHSGLCNAKVCGENEIVQVHKCVACKPGTLLRGDGPVGHFLTTAETMSSDECEEVICTQHQYVLNHTCVDCPEYTTRVVPLPATGSDTECQKIRCGPSQHVKSNTCVDCGRDEYNRPTCYKVEGDWIGGEDTDCTDTYAYLPVESASNAMKSVNEKIGEKYESLLNAKDSVYGNENLKNNFKKIDEKTGKIVDGVQQTLDGWANIVAEGLNSAKEASEGVPSNKDTVNKYFPPPTAARAARLVQANDDAEAGKSVEAKGESKGAAEEDVGKKAGKGRPARGKYGHNKPTDLSMPKQIVDSIVDTLKKVISKDVDHADQDKGML